MVNQLELFKKIEQEALNNAYIYICCGDGMDTMFFPKMVDVARERIIACGISEQNQVSIATGIALQNKKVYCVMMNAFLIHRALDQLKMACFADIDINFIGFSSNLVAMEGGYSHISVDDFAILKNTPNLSIYDPYTQEELNFAIEQTFNTVSPVYIACVVNSKDTYYYKNRLMQNGFSKIYQGEGDLCLISSGDAINSLNLDSFLQNLANRIQMPSIYSCYQIQPFSEEQFIKIIKNYKYLITFESRGEGALYSTIAQIIAKRGLKVKYYPIYLKNEKYNVVGYTEYVLSKYLRLNNALREITRQFKHRSSWIIRKKYQIDSNLNVTVKHKFFGITVSVS